MLLRRLPVHQLAVRHPLHHPHRKRQLLMLNRTLRPRQHIMRNRRHFIIVPIHRPQKHQLGIKPFLAVPRRLSLTKTDLRLRRQHVRRQLPHHQNHNPRMHKVHPDLPPAPLHRPAPRQHQIHHQQGPARERKHPRHPQQLPRHHIQRRRHHSVMQQHRPHPARRPREPPEMRTHQIDQKRQP